MGRTYSSDTHARSLALTSIRPLQERALHPVQSTYQNPASLSGSLGPPREPSQPLHPFTWLTNPLRPKLNCHPIPSWSQGLVPQQDMLPANQLGCLFGSAPWLLGA